jgi:hypothetical protein
LRWANDDMCQDIRAKKSITRNMVLFCIIMDI